MTLNELQDAGLHVAYQVGEWTFHTVAILGPLAANVSLSLYAQTEPSAMMAIAKEFGVLATLVWYVYYDVKFQKPAIQKHYEGVLRDQNEFHKQQREDDREFHKQQREEDRRVHQQMASSYEKVASSLERMSRSCDIDDRPARNEGSGS